ncbi:MAG: hypothetical protein U5L09_05150 [Bacteroidales bacterium]|nr:hypothetical protein [Bacteroidales bacterium]
MNARFCRVNYKQSWSFNNNEKYAIILEDNNDLADRFNGKELDEEDNYLPLDTLALARVAFFAYMTGNTDWSVSPLKNIEILEVPGKECVAVPYDFDLTAFVNAPYAPEALYVKKRQFFERKYKGPKLSKEQIDTVLDRFFDKKEELVSTLETFRFSDQKKQRLVDYLNSFLWRYSTIATNQNCSR